MSDTSECPGSAVEHQVAPLRRVLIANKFVPHYRRPFFEQLRERLAQRGIDLALVYGDPIGADKKKADSIRLDWAIHRNNVEVGIGRWKAIYQPIARLAASYDLVIVEQANRLLINPVLLSMNWLGILRLAYWGHGKDFQGRDNVVTRAFKRATMTRVHWWFAYNERSAEVILESGFPDLRTTRVMNTIDTEGLRRDIEAATADVVEEQKRNLGIDGRNACIYIGGMYDLKRLPFLLAACERIRAVVPDFEMIFLGSGVDRPLIDSFAQKHAWAKACGPRFGHEKAALLKLSKLLLMPGLVGLAVIDSFVAGVPIVTTAVTFHSPEIDYLVPGVNGEVVHPFDSIDSYVDMVSTLLLDKPRLAALRRGCADAAATYTMQAMVERFADGVVQALQYER